jgi:hypothetical protein
MNLYSKGHYWLGPSYTVQGSEIFPPTIWTLWVSKGAKFGVDFKNINLPRSKIYSQIFIYNNLGILALFPLVREMAGYFEITFIGTFFQH